MSAFHQGFATSEERPLTSAMEDYLEAIIELEKKHRVVRVKDLAGKMSVKMPSVTHMLKTLDERNLVRYEPYGHVELTEEGRRIGEETLRRHHIIQGFLTDVLQVEAGAAEADACKMEHILGEETLNSLVMFMTFVQNCPLAGEEWLAHYREYKNTGGPKLRCGAGLEKMIKNLQDHLYHNVCPLKEQETEGE